MFANRRNGAWCVVHKIENSNNKSHDRNWIHYSITYIATLYSWKSFHCKAKYLHLKVATFISTSAYYIEDIYAFYFIVNWYILEIKQLSWLNMSICLPVEHFLIINSVELLFLLYTSLQSTLHISPVLLFLSNIYN